MSDDLQYYPRSAKDYFDLMIRAKRAMVDSGQTSWTAEDSGDYGITLLMLVSQALADLDIGVDNRTKQTASTENASVFEAVIDTARHLGYKPRMPSPAVILLSVTVDGATEIHQGDKFGKDLESGETIIFQAARDCVFEEAGTKTFPAIQGEVKTTSKTGDGTKFQKVYLPHSNVSGNHIIVTVTPKSSSEAIAYDSVTSWLVSGPSSAHYTVEEDYNGRPIIIFGDGVYGRKPPVGSTITVSYRICNGSLGNVSPGTMRPLFSNSHITSVSNYSPHELTLASAVSSTSTEVTVEDSSFIGNFPEAGVAFLNYEDAFSYDGISGNTFQNVTGVGQYHSEGTPVSYSDTEALGEDRPTLREIKLEAPRQNKLKTCAGSHLDYNYLVSSGMSRVARAFSYSVAHTVHLQVVPYYAGVPDEDFLNEVRDFIEGAYSARHSVIVEPPKYVYIDTRLKIVPMPGYDFEAEIEPKIRNLIEYFLSPLSLSPDRRRYVSSWGRDVKRNELVYLILRYYGGVYVADLEFEVFKRSTDLEGNSDIHLEGSQIANIGTIEIREASETGSFEDVVSASIFEGE